MSEELLFQGEEDLLLGLSPSVEGDLVPLEAQPFEEAALGGGPGDHRGDQPPPLLFALQFREEDFFPVAEVVDQPDQDPQVADRPVALELPCLHHPTLTRGLLLDAPPGLLHHCFRGEVAVYGLVDVELLDQVSADGEPLLIPQPLDEALQALVLGL